MMKKLSLILMSVLFTCSFALAQKSISGTVSDSNGDPLIGASVIALGTSVGTITDVDGNFSLEVPAGINMVTVSYTGFETQTIDITTLTNLAVALSEGSLLEEVVVVAAGLERNKARLGYSLQNVDAQDVLESREVNLVDALNSKVAGVSVVSSSGSPGASSTIRIRGAKSINGTNSPLFVVDGVPIDNSSVGNNTGGVDQSNRAIDLNPNDIQDMTILKGPAATALYGVRAANGAIIITTKQGKAGKPVITLSTTYSSDRINKVPERQSTYAQGRPIGGVYTFRGPETAEGFSWGPLISDLEFDGQPNDFDTKGSLVAKGTGNGQAAQAYDPYTFFKTGNSVDMNASVSGGSGDLRYYISGGRLTSTGIVPNATFNRNSFRANVSADLNDRLTVGASANYVQSGGFRIQRGSNIKGVMLGLLRTTPTFDNGNGKVGQAAADDVATILRDSDQGQRSYRSGVYDNPYWTVNKNPSTDNVNRIIGNMNATYKLTDNLNVVYRIGVDNYTDIRNSAIDINPGRDVGSVSQSSISNRDLNSDLLLNYNKNLTSDVSLAVTLGHNYFDSKFVQQGTDGTTLAASDFYHISNATDLIAYENFGGKRLHGALGTIDVGFKDYLFANVTARNDWSSILPKGANTFQSFSGSLGFVFSEAFGINNKYFDYGKLRLSYGQVGNDGGNAFIYSTSSYFNPASSSGDGFIGTVDFPAFGVNSFERSGVLGNPALKAETTTSYEIGGELKFLRNRLSADITYFSATSKDQIIALDLSATTGFTNFVQNAGIITNRGWEVILGVTPIKTKDFSWDIDVNYTDIESEVVELAEGIDDIGLNGFTSTSVDVIPGQPFSVIFGTGWQRTDAGDIIVGSDGWPLSNPTKQPLGDPNPDWTAGIKNTFSYKGVSLAALIDIRQGGDVWCGTCGIMNYFGTSAISADERGDVVVFPGVTQTGTNDAGEPIYSENTKTVALANEADGVGSFYRVRYGFGGITEMNVYDASWVRLRQLSLNYTVPTRMLGNSFVKGVKVGLSGRNLWLSTKYPGIDPETNLTGDSNGYGLDYFNMPNTMSMVGSVSLTF